MIDARSYAQKTSTALPSGTMLRERYRIERILGQGGFGITYSALDTKTYNRVAIKELFPARCVVRGENQHTIRIQQGQEDNFRHLCDSFEKEARILIQLQNQEGIVRLMHVFTENKTAYYVMELLEGEDLMHRLKREGTMTWNELAPIMKTIMVALERIHAVGLIHRDISPDNIYLTDSGARLIDFGSVRGYQAGNHFTAMVKQNFAPWEQFLTNGHQGPWTDIYALAVTAYYCLSGQLPPSATERRFEDKLIPLEVLCPGLPRELCAAIHQGMAVAPEKRFQNITQFSRALMLNSGRTVVDQRGGNVTCLRGAFAGKNWDMQPDSLLRIGRNRECDVVYPRDYQGVSRSQCTIYRRRDGKYLVKDDGSSYGTRLQAMDKIAALEPGVWYCADGAHILFGANEEYVMR